MTYKQRRPQVTGLSSRPGDGVPRRAARAAEGEVEGQYAAPRKVDPQGRITIAAARAVADVDTKASAETAIIALNTLLASLRAAGLLQK